MLLKRLFAVLCLALAGLAHGAEESPGNQGVFNIPGYPQAAPRNATTSGVVRSNPDGRSIDTPRAGSARSEGYRDGDGNPDSSPLSRRAADRAPPVPSEFQKFVERATGRLLPAFGARFFDDAEEVDRSLGNVPVSADYVVGPGDEIVIRAWGAIEVDYRATVDRNGQISLPRVGTFNVSGVKASELDRNLRNQIGRLFTNFDLSVSLGQLRAVQVFVVGPAWRPGVYTLPSQSTMLSAVVAAGGPAVNGSMRRMMLAPQWSHRF